jgi:hypothetical protein
LGFSPDARFETQNIPMFLIWNFSVIGLKLTVWLPLRPIINRKRVGLVAKTQRQTPLWPGSSAWN